MSRYLFCKSGTCIAGFLKSRVRDEVNGDGRMKREGVIPTGVEKIKYDKTIRNINSLL